MKSRIFEALSSRHAPLSSRLVTLKNGHFWLGSEPSGSDHPDRSAQDAATTGSLDVSNHERGPTKVAQREQREAVAAWEDEGGTTRT